MAVTNSFITGLNKKRKKKKKRKPCRSNMFVLSLISLALRATSHIYCVSATEETVLGNDLFESLVYLKCAAEHSISHQ